MLVCIGDLMVDVFAGGDGERRHPGGKAANYAAMARVLGVDAAVIGSVGPDEDGKRVIDALHSCGVNTTGVWVRDEPTGADYFENGDWRMERGANWSLTAADVRRSLQEIASSVPLEGMIVNQGVSLEASQEAAAFAREREVPLVLSLAPEAVEPGRKIDPDYYPDADLIVVNQREAEVLAEHLDLDITGVAGADLARVFYDATQPRWAFLLSWGIKGAHLLLRRSDGQAAPVAVPPGNGSDDDLERYIGAGDAVLAAFVARLLRQGALGTTVEVATVVEALRAAITVGSLTLDYRGTMTAACAAPDRIAAIYT